MASKKFTQSKSPSFSPISHVARLIKDCHIPDNVQIRPLTTEEDNRWRFQGLRSGLLMLGKRQLLLGKRHIETIRFLIHPMILHTLSILQLHLMQLNPNSLKCIVASVILNKVQKKNITVEDLFFAYKVNKSPSKISTK